MRVTIHYTLTRVPSTEPGFDADEVEVRASGDVTVDEYGYYNVANVEADTTPTLNGFAQMVNAEWEGMEERLIEEYRRIQRAP